MPEYDLTYAVTLITVAFGAWIFSALTALLWRERRLRRGSPFSILTLVCAVAFGEHLLALAAPAWATELNAVLDLATAMLPAVLVEVASQGRDSVTRTVFY